jgi:hypothetical protein
MREGFKRVDAQAEADRRDIREGFMRIEAQAEADRQEIREAIGKLIDACEDTRKLSEQVARLAVQTSQRVTNLESKP